MIPALIEAVGQHHFSPRLFRAARQVIGADHLAAFSLKSDAAPVVLFAENVGEAPIALATANCYLSRYWQLDPLWEVMENSKTIEFPCMIELSAHDICDADYRAECYTRVHLRHRLSVCDNRDTVSIGLNFYRAHPFTTQEKTVVADAIDLLLPLIWRHAAELLPVEPRLKAASFRRRLRQMTPCMPQRESEVCAHIAAGLSSEGIALELGLSLNTVLTYRKRAYARLGITSQNELMRCLMA